MGGSSPRVFHTTPPQPALKARTTLYSLSVGGAEASQNGFGDLMPTKSVLRSAIWSPPPIDPSTPHPALSLKGRGGCFSLRDETVQITYARSAEKIPLSP